jgi:hypothetical protein
LDPAEKGIGKVTFEDSLLGGSKDGVPKHETNERDHNEGNNLLAIACFDVFPSVLKSIQVGRRALGRGFEGEEERIVGNRRLVVGCNDGYRRLFFPGSAPPVGALRRHVVVVVVVVVVEGIEIVAKQATKRLRVGSE